MISETEQNNAIEDKDDGEDIKIKKNVYHLAYAAFVDGSR